jgi:hypothetical protein
MGWITRKIFANSVNSEPAVNATSSMPPKKQEGIQLGTVLKNLSVWILIILIPVVLIQLLGQQVRGFEA